MARTDNLNNYLTDVASAIKDKLGDSTPIPAKDFDTKISEIPSGGTEKWKPNEISFAYTNYGFNTTIDFDISNIDLSNITSMKYMFYCARINLIGLENLNTSNITDMSYAFATDSSYKGVNFPNNSTECIKNWDTSKVQNLYSCFSNGNKCDYNYINNWNVSKLNNTKYMFSSTPNVKAQITVTEKETFGKIDLSNWNNNILVNCSYMFSNSRFYKVILPGFVKSTTTDCSSMFYYVYNLEYLDVSGWDTSNVTTFYAFYQASSSSNSKLTTLIGINEFRGTKCTTCERMFQNAGKLTEIDLSNFDTPVLKNCSQMFYGCTSAQRIDIRKMDFSNVTSYSNMFGTTSAAYAVPADCLIIVANDTQKQWITSKFSRMTNVKTVAELEG